MEPRARNIVLAVVSCAILLGVIACILVIFYTTQDSTPRLEFIPQPREQDAGSTLIRYHQGNDNDTKHWVDSLNNFYDHATEGDRSGYQRCSESNPTSLERVCGIDYRGLEYHCNPRNEWGYRQGAPCVILKMNKVLGWAPEVYNFTDIDWDLLPRDMPEDLQETIKRSTADNNGNVPQMIWVSCKGENPTDMEWLGRIEYTPYQGFPSYYFPYLGQPSYESPLVAIRFAGLASSVLVKVVCKTWAKNIDHSMKEGLLRFEILRDKGGIV